MTRYQKVLWLLVILAVVVVASGCAKVQTRKRLDSLERTLKDYGRSIRWTDHELASSHQRFKDDPGRRPLERNFDDARVTSYEIIQEVVHDDDHQAEVTVAISYYLENTGVVRDMKNSQHWYFSEEADRWFLDSELPDFYQSR